MVVSTDRFSKIYYSMNSETVGIALSGQNCIKPLFSNKL